MRYYIFLFFFLFVLNVDFLKAQNPAKLDSLWTAYRTQQNDSLKLNAASYLAFHYIFKTPSKADSILKAALNYAELKKKNYNYIIPNEFILSNCWE